jgi:hypothetical protein
MRVFCRVCRGVGWVCEDHPDKPYDHDIGCACGEGIPCACNDSTPPDTSQVIVIDEVTLH